VNTEEVFLLVARGDSTPESKAKLASSRAFESSKPNVILEDEKSNRSRMDLDNEALFTRHLNALFKKRALNFQRDKKAWVCTTILPILIVTLGFIIFAVSSPDRDLSPVTLELAAFNTDVTSQPINPVPVNEANNPFTCQPGTCSYFPIVQDELTSETYTFCGSQGLLGLNESMDGIYAGSPNCTIDLSTDILQTLDNFQGVKVIETQTETIEQVSLTSTILFLFIGISND
jgi:hypothetical protein